MHTSFESHSKHLFPSTGCGVWPYLHTGQLGKESKQNNIGYRPHSKIWNLVEIVELQRVELRYFGLRLNLSHQLFTGMSPFPFRSEWKSGNQETDGWTDE